LFIGGSKANLAPIYLAFKNWAQAQGIGFDGAMPNKNPRLGPS